MNSALLGAGSGQWPEQIAQWNMPAIMLAEFLFFFSSFTERIHTKICPFIKCTTWWFSMCIHHHNVRTCSSYPLAVTVHPLIAQLLADTTYFIDLLVLDIYLIG